MKITEKWLLDNLSCITQYGDLISEKEYIRCYWGYGLGCGNDYRRVSYRDEADSIHIEYVDVAKEQEKIYSIDLPRYPRNKVNNDKAQEMIRKWNKEVLA